MGDELEALRARHAAEEGSLERTIRYEALLGKIHDPTATEQEWAEYRALRDEIATERTAERIKREAEEPREPVPGDAVATPETIAAGVGVNEKGGQP